ncbi:MAG: hypothetical protein M1457_08715 [bacterium]|nr:hypothetical protein [bacterium]
MFGEKETVDYQKELDALRNDINCMRKDLGELLRGVVDLGKHGAGDARERVTSEIGRRLRQFNESYRNLKAGSKQAAGTIHHTMEERPLTSVLIALGVGLVLGKLLSRD